MSIKFRAIVRIDDAGMACNVGGAVHTTYETVDFESEALARIMRRKPNESYTNVQIVGVSTLLAADNESPGG